MPLEERVKVRVTVEPLTEGRHSLLDALPISLGGLLTPASPDVDLLGEMLEGPV